MNDELNGPLSLLTVLSEAKPSLPPRRCESRLSVDQTESCIWWHTITLEDVLAVTRKSSDPVVTAKESGDNREYSSEAARQKVVDNSSNE
jgi:hypothetical protein